MNCIACTKELTPDEERWGDTLGTYECLACREKRLEGRKGRKSAKVMCPCQREAIHPPLATCSKCFTEQASVMEVLMDILQHHGAIKMLAAKPIIEKAVQTGWKDEYMEEYQVNLLAVSKRLSKEDQEVNH